MKPQISAPVAARVAPALIAIVSLLVGGVAGYYIPRKSEAPLLASGADASAASLRQRIDELEAQNRSLRQAAVSPAPAGKAEMTPKPGPAPATAAAALRSNPQFDQLRTVREAGRVDSHFSRLFRRWGLDETKTKEVKNLLLERQMTMNDAAQVAREQGLDITSLEGRKALNEMAAKFRTEFDERLRQEVGAEKYAEFKAYEQSLPQRNSVEELERRLSRAGVPLQDAQFEQLVSAVSPSRPGEGRAITMQNGVLIARFNEDALARAQPLLSPPQYEIMKTLQAEHKASLELSRLTQNSGATSGPAQSAPPAKSGTPAPNR